jgi:glutaredoxin
MYRQKALYTSFAINLARAFIKNDKGTDAVNKARVVLYTKNNCGLCEKMKAEMARAACDESYTLEEVDIEKDAELLARYRYEIPVLFINGREAFRHRLSSDEFRARINSASTG